jgi:uncharacterized protein (DUF488 family)
MTYQAAVTTIGFTGTSAKGFFERLLRAGVQKVMDVRLHNRSQLAGFAKADDLAFFLGTIGNIAYTHEPLLTPTQEILKAYRNNAINWDTYATRFLGLMKERKIEDRLQPKAFEGTCLLCSEATPHHCHRRLVCEYLNGKWDGALSVTHL